MHFMLLIVSFSLLATNLLAEAAPKIPDDVHARIEAALPEAAVAEKPAKPRKVLVFSPHEYFLHKEPRCYLAVALELMGERTGAFTVEHVSNPLDLSKQRLSGFDAIVMNNGAVSFYASPVELFFDKKNNRTFDKEVFAALPADEKERLTQRDTEYKQALLDFVRGGGALLGVHGATWNSWKEYDVMLGAAFAGHPWGDKDTSTIKMTELEHRLCAPFKEMPTFEITDEIYQFKAPYSRSINRVILSLDIERSLMTKPDGKPRGIRTDNDYAVAWIKRYGEGRVFYCSLGHNPYTTWDKRFLRFYLDGLQYVLGDLKVDDAPSSVAGGGK